MEAIGPGETTPRGKDCGPGQCTSAGNIVVFGGAAIVGFTDYQPASVTISVITANGTTTYNKTPTYKTIPDPNGPGCGKDAIQAIVTVP